MPLMQYRLIPALLYHLQLAQEHGIGDSYRADAHLTVANYLETTVDISHDLYRSSVPEAIWDEIIPTRDWIEFKHQSHALKVKFLEERKINQQ